ncbi:MAG: GAF domain-containing protein, partial [Gemmataceae bacterium]
MLLDLAKEHQLPELLRLLVSRLADSPRVALARVWLVRPGDICDACPMKAECPSRVPCLHLVSSAGRSKTAPAQEWTRLDGAFRRFPLGVRKVGRIGASGEAIEAPDLSSGTPDWIANPEWLRAEGINGFGGQPLVHRGETLGVLAVFARGPIGHECMDWLRTIADHTAAAIATARAFEEIEALKKRLELENEYLREEVTRSGVFGELVGQSPALEAVSRQIDLVAPTDSAVLVLGESGTGKELV